MRSIYIWFIAAVFIACSPAKEIDDVWINKEKLQGKTYGNLFIVALTADIEVREKLETKLAAAAISKGYKAVKSIDVMKPSIKDPKLPTKDEVVTAVKESGCDAVLIASLFKQEDEVKHTAERNAYATGATNYYTGNYYGYYSTWYPTVSEPAYFSVNKKYYMQTNVYDVATEEVMLSVKSNVFSPYSLDDFSKIYISNLMEQLKKAKIQKK